MLIQHFAFRCCGATILHPVFLLMQHSVSIVCVQCLCYYLKDEFMAIFLKTGALYQDEKPETNHSLEMEEAASVGGKPAFLRGSVIIQ